MRYTDSMKKLFFLLILVSAFGAIFFAQSTFAQPAEQPRYAECDLCGYCNGKEVPQAWEECRTCIYPEIAGVATENETLRIDTSTNLPPRTAKGRFYTQIGCISTNLSDFTNPEGAAVLVNSILNRLIFPTVGGIALLYLIYGAFILITSQSNPEKIAQGKTMVMGAIIGLVFTLSVVLIVNVIANQLLRAPGFSSQEESITPTVTQAPTQ